MGRRSGRITLPDFPATTKYSPGFGRDERFPEAMTHPDVGVVMASCVFAPKGKGYALKFQKQGLFKPIYNN